MGNTPYLFDVIVLGAGGTGTYFLKEFSRYLYGNRKAGSRVGQLVIFDGDRVEKKNLARQCFAPEDVGAYKAAVMAGVLNDAFGLSWKGYGEYVLSATDLCSRVRTGCRSFVKGGYEQHIPLVIGCVDNHACRLVLEDFFNSLDTCLYYDSANEFSSGEVVFSVKRDGRVFSPLRSAIFPEIKKGDLRNVTELSCTELNEVSPQHIRANMQAGGILLSACTKLLETGVSETGSVFFDTEQLAMVHRKPRPDLIDSQE